MEHFKRKWETDITEPEVRPLYQRWVRMAQEGRDPEFDDFDTFYWWAKTAGYVKGAMLKRINPEFPHSPENCVFLTDTIRQSIKKFDETVAKIRRACGLPPLIAEVHDV